MMGAEGFEKGRVGRPDGGGHSRDMPMEACRIVVVYSCLGQWLAAVLHAMHICDVRMWPLLPVLLRRRPLPPHCT
jgi:hypothetical protein